MNRFVFPCIFIRRVCLCQYRSQEVFYKKGVIENFPKFTGKHQYQSLLFNKIEGLDLLTNIISRKIKTFQQCFHWKIKIYAKLSSIFLHFFLTGQPTWYVWGRAYIVQFIPALKIWFMINLRFLFLLLLLLLWLLLLIFLSIFLLSILSRPLTVCSKLTVGTLEQVMNKVTYC